VAPLQSYDSRRRMQIPPAKELRFSALVFLLKEVRPTLHSLVHSLVHPLVRCGEPVRKTYRANGKGVLATKLWDSKIGKFSLNFRPYYVFGPMCRLPGSSPCGATFHSQIFLTQHPRGGGAASGVGDN
jgi:hypothetical protein